MKQIIGMLMHKEETFIHVIIDTVCSRPKVIATFYPFEMHIVEFYLFSGVSPMETSTNKHPIVIQGNFYWCSSLVSLRLCVLQHIAYVFIRE